MSGINSSTKMTLLPAKLTKLDELNNAKANQGSSSAFIPTATKNVQTVPVKPSPPLLSDSSSFSNSNETPINPTGDQPVVMRIFEYKRKSDASGMAPQANNNTSSRNQSDGLKTQKDKAAEKQKRSSKDGVAIQKGFVQEKINKFEVKANPKTQNT